MKLAVCTPLSWNEVPRDFFFHYLSQFGMHRADALRSIGIDQVVPLFCDAILISHNRNILARNFLDLGAEWSLWLDADMTHPHNLVDLLLADARKYESRIVSGLYFGRKPPHLPVAGFMDHRHQLALDVEKPGVYEVDYVGFGCILIHREVFEQIGTPCFYYDLQQDLGDFASEDLSFCKKAKASGFKIVVNTRVQCGHLTQKIVTHADWKLNRDGLRECCRVGEELKPSAPVSAT